MYDKEFEEFWGASEFQFIMPKYFAYAIWQSARSHNPEKQSIKLEGGDFGVYTALLNNNNGRERKTKEDAEKAAQAMLKRDRLAAFVYEHCGFEEEFIEGSQDNFFIYYDYEQDIYDWAYEDGFPDLCKQYMPEATAIWLCEKLNSGEIVL